MTRKKSTKKAGIVHTLICGVTMTGKTTLARKISRGLLARGHRVIVRDPLGTATAGGGWGDGAVIFGPGEDAAFWDYVARDDVSGAHIFIDEAGDFFGVGDKDNFWLLTRGRHFWLQVYLLCQRPKMLAPTVRSQCGYLYFFRLSRDDTKEIVQDFGHDAAVFEPLDTGDYYMLVSGSSAIARGNVFHPTR